MPRRGVNRYFFILLWPIFVSVIWLLFESYPVSASIEISQMVCNVASNRFFRLQIHPKDDFGETPEGEAWGIPCPNCGKVHSNSYEEAMREEKTIDIWGVVVDSGGMAFIPDPLIEPRFIKGISAWDLSGKKLEASLIGILPQAQIMVLKVGGRKWETLEFPSSGEPSYVVTPEEKMGKSSFRLAPIPSIEHFSQSGCWIEVPPGGLIFDAKGKVLGYSTSGRLGVKGETYPWRFNELLKVSPIRFDELQAVPEITAFCNNVAEVQFKYREVAAGSETKGYGYPYSYEDMADEFESEPSGYYYQEHSKDYVDPESVFYGIPVRPDAVIVPVKLSKKRVARIKSITVKIHGKEYEGKFLGMYKDFWTILIGLPQPLFSVVPIAEPIFIPHAMVRTVSIRQVRGQRENRVWYNRVDDFRKSRRNVWRPHFVSESKSVRIFLTSSGEAIGIELTTRGNRISTERDYGSSDTIDFYSFQELKKMAEKPEDFVDASWTPVDEREEKRLVWLGVEFQGMNRHLAKANHLEGPTRDGNIGLLVSHVYSGSPAERLGIKVGDILLDISTPGVGKPIELIEMKREDRHWDMMQELEKIPEEYKDRYMERMPPPWPPTKNALNSLLTKVGPGEKAIIHYWSEGRDLQKEILLEKGPYDFESADRLSDSALGLHVRDITYEVRRYYALDADYKGVIVAKVDSGSKASVAKILSYEMVIEINGKPLGNASEFRKTLEELKKQGVASLEFKIERMGKKRVVKIDL